MKGRVMNSAILVGDVSDRPEMRQTQNGKMYAYLRVRTREQYTKFDGSPGESVEWHTVKIWGKTAQQAVNTLSIGSIVEVVGSIRSFKDADDTRRLWEIKADRWSLQPQHQPQHAPAAPFSQNAPFERPNDFLLPGESPGQTQQQQQQHNPTPWGEGFTRR